MSIGDVLRKMMSEPLKKVNYLVVFPASGMMRRLEGEFAMLHVGGETGWAPFILHDSKTSTAIDSRAMIYEEESLFVVYNPRHHIERIDKNLRKWLEANPDVFNAGSIKSS